MGRQGFVVTAVVVCCWREPGAVERRSVVARETDACIVETEWIG